MTNFGSNDVSVIDTGTNAVVATVPVGTTPWGVAVTPDGSHAYVTNFGSNDVSVIDTGTNAVVATIPVGTAPAHVAVTPDGSHAYVTNAGSNNVSVIDTATNTVVATVPGFNEPASIAITPTPRPSPPSLTITKASEGKFVQGQQGEYTITVGNAGAGPTDGTPVTVRDTLPQGMEAQDISGPGWNCTLGTLTCTRNDVLAPGGTYPPITLTVRVSSKAPEQVTNVATVTGGGDARTHIATAPTTIKPKKHCKPKKPEESNQSIDQPTTQHNATGPTNFFGNQSNDAALSAMANTLCKK